MSTPDPQDPAVLADEILKLRADLSATQAALAITAVFLNGFHGKVDPHSLGLEVAPGQEPRFAATFAALLALVDQIDEKAAV